MVAPGALRNEHGGAGASACTAAASQPGARSRTAPVTQLAAGSCPPSNKTNTAGWLVITALEPAAFSARLVATTLLKSLRGGARLGSRQLLEETGKLLT